MASSDSQIDKPQRGRPKRAELPDVNINTGAQSINTEKASLIRLKTYIHMWFGQKGRGLATVDNAPAATQNNETVLKAVQHYTCGAIRTC